ncbi:MAG TPA: TIGR03118 family protein [Ktedonobacterales bacterium]|nr:TIGR03118 family protein [Ktedonobacterales bacterium]
MVVYHFSGKLRLLTLALTLGLSLTLALPLTASAHSRDGNRDRFEQTNLVSDIKGLARVFDPNLVNPWGIVAVPNDGPFWIADNGTGLSTVYDGRGNPFPPKTPLVVTIPPPSNAPQGATAAPTGIVLNTADPDDVVVSKNGKSGPARFLFATEDGTISGWNPNVDPTNAILKVDNANTTSGPVYKGLAEGSNRSGDFLFATNFRFGRVDVFNSRFKLVSFFTDPQLANDCPIAGPPKQCFAPFGIRNIGGKLFVTFALQDSKHHDDVNGAGNGFVDIFSTRGKLLRRLIAHGPAQSPLDSPWGLVLAPDHFGRFSGDLLVGNFGAFKTGKNPSINAFDLNGNFQGNLKDETGHPISIDGLWGLNFGDDVLHADPHALYFTAGINDEADGLFGKLTRDD